MKKGSLLAAVVLSFLGNSLVYAGVSTLWGTYGEKWTAAGRLPDFSFAGYHSSNVQIPFSPVFYNVIDFGAKGDGVNDDSAAFQRAIDATPHGVISVPAGRYKLTKMLKIQASSVVLRGAGTGKTVLFFPLSLTAAVGNGEQYAPGGSWSWSGGFISIVGNNRDEKITTVVADERRGSRQLTVASATRLAVNQSFHLTQIDTDGSLGRHLHADQANASVDLKGRKLVYFTFIVTKIDGNRITINRPLRTDVRTVWTPSLSTDRPAVEEVGIENLSIEFPLTRYAGHHVEPGYNAIDFQRARNSWVKNIEIRNSDTGIIFREETAFCTVDRVKLYADAGRGYQGNIGHQGFIVADLSRDNVFQNFQFIDQFIHDISLTSMANGNVFSKGTATNIRFDHHRKAPYENLFTEIDAGRGSDVWYSGGDEDAGPHTAARETFWNIKSDLPISLPSWAIQMNWIAVETGLAQNLSTVGNWIERVLSITPQNLFEAQISFRKNPIPTATPAPTPTSAQPSTQASQTPVVTPQPWVAGIHTGQPIKISRLTGDGIEIYNTRRELVRNLSIFNSEATWDLTNNDGGRTSSGTYIFYVLDGDARKPVGKIVIIR